MPKKLIPFTIIALVIALVACSGESGAQSDAESMSAASLETDDQKTLYALGQFMAQQLGQFDLSADEFATVKEGLSDGILGVESKVDMDEFGPKIQAFAMGRAQRVVTKEKEAGTAFVEKAAAEEGAQAFESGLVYTELVAGTGASPTATDKVKVHYHGTLRDGTVFDSSVDRGEPIEFGLNQVVACWTEGVQKMKVGGKAKLVCPPEIAYGDQPRPPKIPGGATLVFEVELLEITTPSS